LKLTEQEIALLTQIVESHPFGEGTRCWAVRVAIRLLHGVLFEEEPVLLRKMETFKRFIKSGVQ
jgi:hypothetical protein